MTPEKWLEQNGKKPYHTEQPWHYWGTLESYDPTDPTNEENETDFLLPLVLWSRLKQKTTYPEVKMYRTQEEAMVDFRQAFENAISDGWKP